MIYQQGYIYIYIIYNIKDLENGYLTQSKNVKHCFDIIFLNSEKSTGIRFVIERKCSVWG